MEIFLTQNQVQYLNYSILYVKNNTRYHFYMDAYTYTLHSKCMKDIKQKKMKAVTSWRHLRLLLVDEGC